MELNISTTKNAGKTVITLSGKLNTLTSQQLSREFDTALPDTTELIIEMKDTDYVSSAGLRLLVTAHKKMKTQNGTMTINNVRDEVMEVFEMTGLVGVFHITKD